MCEQGSSSSFIPDESPKPKIVVEKFDAQILKPSNPDLTTSEGKKTPKKKIVQKKKYIQSALDTTIEKSKPKRMGSERPDEKSPRKLRRVSIIKNSFSLRVNKKNEKRKTSKKSRFSESENDMSSNREYSEEQGRKAFNFNPSSH